MRRFVDAFQQRHGRAPRVLHLSNIANNAFLNAKLLNEAGFDCDVLCGDYYHIMGCPEWEDADFSGDVGDQFRPDWSAVDLGGYARPPWFAQGPGAVCIEYLIARRTGNDHAAQRLWKALAIENRTIRSKALRIRIHAMRLLSTMSNRIVLLKTRPDAYELVLHKLSVWAHQGGIPWRAFRLAVLPFVWLAFRPTVWRRRLADRDAERRRWRRDGRERRATNWAAIFADTFPDRTDQLTAPDYWPYSGRLDRWSTLLSHYDFVIGYAVAGVYPMLAGVPYVTFEHGTLREIPYRQTGEGRLTALAYRKAQHVFVTNFDCLRSADYLAPQRYTLINHPFDEDHGLSIVGWETQRAQLCHELDADFLFFFPTRHDWVKGTGYADKGNDVFIRAFGQLRAMGYRAGVICCAWGANVEQSRELFASLRVDRHVKWISPLPTVAFERMARASHCVADQFILGSFGGVMFKAMAVGAPVLTYLDEAQLACQYPSPPPVINCRTTDDIVRAVPKLISDPAALAVAGTAARQWMKRHHSKRETVHKQVRVFESLLGAQAG